MKYLLLLLLLSSCDSVKHKADVPVYHERSVYEQTETITVIIDRTHEIIPGRNLTTWRLAGTRLTITGSEIESEPLDVFERPLAPISGTEYHALDTGACLDIRAEEKLTITLCESSPDRPSIIVEAYR